MQKYDAILAAEEQFAREVTLGVIVSRPPSVWHYLIPGMFIIDFLLRSSAIRQYGRHFMFPRKLAIDAARAFLQGNDKDSIRSHIENDVSNWLNSLKLYSPGLLQAQAAVIGLLAEHYLKLLNGEKHSYYRMIESAYHKRENFEAFLDQLREVENEVDRAIMLKLGQKEKLKQKLLLEKQQLEKRRRKMMDEIF